MLNSIIKSFEIWSTAQTQKSMGRNRGIDNIHFHGVKRLRELILELAVRGKLVPQDSNDEPAIMLLKKIAEQKKQLIREGKIKKQEVLPEVGDDEKPFDLPNGWKWVKLGNIGYTQTGGTPSKNDKSLFGSDVPFIKPGDIYPNYVDYFNEGLSYKGVESLGRLANEGSILMVCIGTIGKCNFINRTCTFNQQINSLSPYFNGSKYLLLSLKSKYFQDKAWEKSSSTTIAILNKGKWENIGIPVPPLAEQQRIVAKVDELMALCDKLEQQQTNHNENHHLLVETLLKTLTDVADADELKEAWQRIEANFDILFTTEESVDLLKQTILQLAVMGKLTQQNPSDEPASELLKQIAKEKARMVKEGKIKKQAPLPEITDGEKPFDLPVGWEWVRPDDFSTKITDGEHFRPQTQNDGVYFLSAKDIRADGVSLDEPLFISKETAEAALQRCNPERGDILIVSRGATVGRMCTVNIDDIFCLLGSVILIKPVKLINSEYLKVVMKTPHTINQLVSASGSTAQPAIYLRDLKKITFPIAPLAEQHRIVSKVDELFALCDTLKERIIESQEIKVKLAEAVVEGAVKHKPAGKVIYAANEQLSIAAEPEGD
jgi:type I restriction enzyme S subunit